MIDVKEHSTAGMCTLRRCTQVGIHYRTALGFDFIVPYEKVKEGAVFHAEEPGEVMEGYILDYLKVRNLHTGEPFLYTKNFPSEESVKKGTSRG